MGRGRAPCCQKIGLHKGSWTPQEDIRLISYIREHGHGNWRALPKQAGLLRCGKSCRLRWINYLRPGIKRGNFTKEEEDAIINLHQVLGNKWSKIASFLPGRTDNEIKNVWNTHLKKRLNHEKHPTQSSTTIATSSSSLQKIDIPIEPHINMWDTLDFLSPNLSILPPSPSPPPPLVEDDDILMDIPIDSDLWSDVTNIDSMIKDFDSNLVEESKSWLAYLEEELGLISMQEGDSMGSYFSKRPSSSSPSFTKLVDFNCINA